MQVRRQNVNKQIVRVIPIKKARQQGCLADCRNACNEESEKVTSDLQEYSQKESKKASKQVAGMCTSEKIRKQGSKGQECLNLIKQKAGKQSERKQAIKG